MRRRDFLHPRHLARAAGQVLGALQDTHVVLAQATIPDAALLQYSRRAMATSFELLLPVGTPSAMSAASAALDEIDRLEAQLSIYRDDSEVSLLNREAAERAFVVEPDLFDLLARARDVWEATGGAFDVTAGALIRTWGFFHRQGRVPSATELAAARQRVGSEHLIFDNACRSLRFDSAGIEINFGSIGKGHALDRAGELLRRDWGLPSALLHGGHSSVLAVGCEPGSRRGWPVGIRHPWKPEQRLAVVQLRDRALATSAATFQHIEYEGRKLGHILDPRTGWPAEGLASASAIAPDAALADALSTAFFVLGIEGTRAFCELNPTVGAVLLPPGGGVVPTVFNLDAEEIALCG